MKGKNANAFDQKLKGLLPKSLASQFIWLLMITLLISQVLTALILIDERKEALSVLNRKGNLNRIASTVRLLEESPQSLHQNILHAVSSENILYWFEKPDPGNLAEQQNIDPQFSNRLKSYGIQSLVIIKTSEKAFYKHKEQPRFHADKKLSNRNARRKVFEISQIAIQLRDGRWLNVASRFHVAPPLWPTANTISILITGTLLILLSIFMIRRITRPLAKLTQAAKKLGLGEAVEPLAEVGPEDIKTATSAFNQMNGRLERYITDRTNMLAAVSHDLRTPITTLRLRTELMDEGPTQDAFLNTLDEMQAITDATLSFIREGKSEEENQTIDLNRFIQDICHDFNLNEERVFYQEQDSLPYPCRAMAIKRALTNLIDNALYYGNKAHISLTSTAHQVVINIKDEGPGIEASQIDEVFKPFVRLDKSRTQSNGRMGLGLAITRSIICNHGGEIQLSNHPEGGLNVRISLPLHE